MLLLNRFEVGVNRLEDTEHVVIPVHLREKYKQSGYNHSSTPLFGLPFLITIPRTLSEEKFYNLLLLRLWYGSLDVPSTSSLCLHEPTPPPLSFSQPDLIFPEVSFKAQVKYFSVSLLQSFCALSYGRRGMRRDALVQAARYQRQCH